MARPTRTPVAGLTPGFQERQFAVGGITLNYVVGPASGLPLLLIPGQMESWQGYKLVLPELTKHFHVYVVDIRGHGKSTHTPGQYSYNRCGEDLRAFIRGIIGSPTLVAGLSSGGVLALWLAANAPDDILAVISEDPPIYSSILPRIKDEKYMNRTFRLAVDILGATEPHDVERYLVAVGVPKQGQSELQHIPPFIMKALFWLYRRHRRRHPDRPFDVPFLPFNMRAGLKSMLEYDTDFSRATADGDLGAGFYPDETLSRITCPTLLMKATATRHEEWGIMGAMDDADLARVVSLVKDIRVVHIPCRHEIHMLRPREYSETLIGFVTDLQAEQRTSPKR